jgi:IS5 family transposase
MTGIFTSAYSVSKRTGAMDAKLHADKGYDFSGCRRLLRRRNMTPRIARRGVKSNIRLGRQC